MISIQSPQCRHLTLINNFLDLVNLSVREEAILATNWIKDRPDGLKASEPCIGHYDRPNDEQFTENMSADVQYAITKCESLGSGKRVTLYGNPSAIAQDFFPHMPFLRRQFLPNMHLQCCMIIQCTLGGNFDVFAASGKSTAWVLLWKTRSRPIGVRVCLVDQFNFFSTAFDPRAWTIVVFWKESLGRQSQLITTENEGEKY